LWGQTLNGGGAFLPFEPPAKLLRQ